jgi:hypothetical protein
MRSDGAMWHCRRAATNAGVIYYPDCALGTGDVGNWSETVRVPEGECAPDGMAHFPHSMRSLSYERLYPSSPEDDHSRVFPEFLQERRRQFRGN